MSVRRYLKRLDASLDDKMKVVQFIDDDAEYVLDVGCASGHVTGAMASIREDVHFHGIDVELPLVGMAQNQAIRPNTSFSHNWLSDLHKYDTKYDVITFMSVLHEFYSYGEGTTSVIKALCDAYELLKPDGVIIIRDMLRLNNESNVADRFNLYSKLESNPHVRPYLTHYDERWDIHRGIAPINDFLLHMLYTDNWANELREQYMFWSAKDYVNLARYLDLHIEALDCYLLDYVKDRWRKELWLNEMEMSNLYSTGVIVLRK